MHSTTHCVEECDSLGDLIVWNSVKEEMPRPRVFNETKKHELHPDRSHHPLKVHALPIISEIPVLSNMNKIGIQQNFECSNDHYDSDSITSDCRHASQHSVLPFLTPFISDQSTPNYKATVVKNETLPNQAAGFNVHDESTNQQSSNPPNFRKSISYYQDVCNKLSKEKDKLEGDKEQIKHDLSTLQTEIQGNEKAVKSLQQTMDKLQKSKQKLNKVHEARAICIQQCENAAKSPPINEPVAKESIIKTDCSFRILSTSPASDLPSSFVSFNETQADKKVEEASNNVDKKILNVKNAIAKSKQKLAEVKGKHFIDIDMKELRHTTPRDDISVKLSETETTSAKNKAYENQILMLQVKLEASESRAKVLREEMLKGIQENEDSCQELLRKSSKQLQIAKQELISTKQQVTSVEEKLKNAKERADSKVYEAEENKKKAEEEMLSLRNEVLVTKQELQRICEKKDTEKTRLESKAKMCEENLLEMTKKANELKEELKNLYVRAEIAESKHSKAEERADRAEKEVALNRKQFLDFELQLKVMSDKKELEIKELQLKLSAAEGKLSEYGSSSQKEEIEKLQERAESAETKCAQAEKSLETAKEENIQCKERAHHIEQNLQGMYKEEVAERKTLETNLSTVTKSLLEATKHLDELKAKHTELKIRAEKAEKKLTEESEKRSVVESELSVVRKRAIATDEELHRVIQNAKKENQNFMERTQKIKEKNISIFQESAQKIRELEQTLAEREKELCKVNEEAEAQIKEATAQLHESEEMMEKLQAKVQKVCYTVAKKDEELMQAQNIAKTAKEDLLILKCVVTKKEKTLNSLVEQANRVSIEAVEKAKKMENYAKLVEKSKQKTIDGNVEELTKLRKLYETRIGKTEEALNMEKVKNASCLVLLKNKNDEITRLKRDKGELPQNLDESDKKASYELPAKLELQELQKMKDDLTSLQSKNSKLCKQVDALTSDKISMSSANHKVATLCDATLNMHEVTDNKTHHDQIHDKMASFITNLKSAQENILVHVDDMKNSEVTLRDLQVKSSHRFCFHSENSNGTKKWVLGDIGIRTNLTTHGVELSKVTSDICKKMKRLDSHLKQWENESFLMDQATVNTRDKVVPTTTCCRSSRVNGYYSYTGHQ